MKEQWNDLVACIIAYLTKMGYSDEESKELYDSVFDRLETFEKNFIQ